MKPQELARRLIKGPSLDDKITAAIAGVDPEELSLTKIRNQAALDAENINDKEAFATAHVAQSWLSNIRRKK